MLILLIFRAQNLSIVKPNQQTHRVNLPSNKVRGGELIIVQEEVIVLPTTKEFDGVVHQQNLQSTKQLEMPAETPRLTL